MTSQVQLIRQIMKFMTKGPAFDRVADKVRVISGGNGRCVCEMTVEEEHQNRGGTLHGGLTATLVDQISTTALLTNENTGPGVSVELSVSYLSAAKTGDDIVIDANTLKVGKSLAYLAVDITNKKTGKLVAVGKHTKHLGGGALNVGSLGSSS